MKALQSYTDEQLMDLLKDKSILAFEELYLRYSQKLLALMSKMLNHNESLAQDLLHDTFLKLIEKPEVFNTQRKFKPWIYSVVANACRKTYRIKVMANIETVETAAFETEMPHQVERQLDTFRSALNKALDEISYVHKETFVLKHQHGLSIKDIAGVLGCAEGTVKSRLHTARKILADKLKTHHPKSTI